MLEGYEARIVNDNMFDVPPGEIGLLLVRGKSTFAHYWHRNDETRRTLLGEWVNTGDLVYRDSEGFIYFCGRVDHSFKARGLWVSPAEIEIAIVDSGFVTACCVVPKLSLNGITDLVAYIVSPSKETSGHQLEIQITKYLENKLEK